MAIGLREGRRRQKRKQRNALLKQSEAPPDDAQMALWDAQLAAAGTRGLGLLSGAGVDPAFGVKGGGG